MGATSPRTAPQAENVGKRLTNIWKYILAGSGVFLGLGGFIAAYFAGLLNEVLPSPRELRCSIEERFSEPAPGSHFTILLSDLHYDVDGRQTDHVRHALEGQLGFDVHGTCAVLKVDRHRLQSTKRDETMKEGQRWLKDKNADLLIWGEVSEENQSLRLWFLNREGDSTLGSKPYVLNHTELPQEFSEDFNAQLLAIASASILPVNRSIGTYLVSLLKPIVIKLQNLQRHFPPDFTPEQRGGIHLSLGIATLIIGDQTGGTEAERWLTTAIDAQRAALNELNREHDPLLWALAQQGLGAALSEFGNNEVANQKLEDALKALDAASDVLARSDIPPLLWALSQLDRGNVLVSLGRREAGKGRLRDALAAYEMALREPSLRQDEPVFRAAAEAGRGNALASLAHREVGDERLNEALKAYRDALNVLINKDVPFIRARLQRSLASGLVVPGQRQGSIELLKEADTLLQKVTPVLTREKAPYDWALIQQTRGNTFAALSFLESASVWLNEAEKAYLAALDVLNPADSAFAWAITTSNRGYVLTLIGQRENDKQRLKQAVDILQSAVAVLNPEDVPISWADTQMNLGVALMALGTLEASEDPLKRSIDVFNAALETLKSADATRSVALVERNLDAAKSAIQIRALENAITVAREPLKELTQQETPLEWAKSQHQLGDALSSLGEAHINHGREDLGTKRLKEAVLAYQEALQVRTQKAVPLDWAATNHRLGDALSNLGIALITSGKQDLGRQRLEKAVDAYHEALKQLTQKVIPSDWASSHRDLDDGFFIQSFKLNGPFVFKQVTQITVSLNSATAQRNIGDALFFLGRVEEVISAYREALKKRFYKKKSLEWVMIQHNLSVAQEIVALRQKNGRMMCEALQDHMEVLKFVLSSQQVFGKPVFKSIESSFADQIAILNSQPRTESLIARKCLKELKPTLVKTRMLLQN